MVGTAALWETRLVEGKEKAETMLMLHNDSSDSDSSIRQTGRKEDILFMMLMRLVLLVASLLDIIYSWRSWIV